MDISEDLNARKRAEQSLRDNEQRLRAVLDSAMDAIITMDHEGRIVEFNSAAELMFGHLRSAVVGREMAQLIVPPALREQHRRGLAHYRATGVGPALNRRLELSALRLDGSEFPIELSITRVADSEPPLFTGFIRDITERKTFERELVAAKEAAEAANLAKSNFLSSMSHEMRTPLNAILGFGQLMASDDPAPNSSQQANIGHILQAGWHLLALINEILDLALIESGKLPLSMERISITKVVRECQAMIETQAQKRCINVAFPPFDIPYFVNADPLRVKQVVINLLSNAIKYNKEGGTIVVNYAATHHGRIRISVQDTGQGLTPENLAQLFQPFNRLGQENAAAEGTGIGLVVTKRLVELMGGVIGVESIVGKGSVFWIEMNLIAEPHSAAPAPS